MAANSLFPPERVRQFNDLVTPHRIVPGNTAIIRYRTDFALIAYRQGTCDKVACFFS